MKRKVWYLPRPCKNLRPRRIILEKEGTVPVPYHPRPCVNLGQGGSYRIGRYSNNLDLTKT